MAPEAGVEARHESPHAHESDPARWADLGDKLARLTDLARAHDLDTLVLREPAALTWLLGARVNVPQTLDAACLDVIVHVGASGTELTVVTNAIEAPRLLDTELAGLDAACDARWEVVPWWESRDGRLPSGTRVGCDRALRGSVPVGPDLAALRRRLTPHQQGLLEEVCSDTAAAATAAALTLSPSTTGYAAAGALARELLERGLDPIVLLVGGADHLATHRHPLPLPETVGERAMLVACGRRHGLVASVTRIVSFTPLDEQQRDGYARLLRVERAFLDATRVGARLGDVVSEGCAAYGRHGFDPEEWHRHHQGGLSGFQPREFPAHAGSDHVLGDGAVVAWNPSAAGWKVEDTTLVLPEGARTLVTDEQWPSIDIGGRRRPDVLVR
ncbi:M24 family metallopeptidase [Humibacillus xanthopallidus]|uniref:Antitoxin VapB n=1 Tax=Humibacillus xanthopallidus TaxID=412689 RepID=A0A543HA66_9MICO|nr:M24 family metallopeptidase [Humibacillus xanthopallidus]TQM55213.1 antitoxin VapB [Humibacillus xanthopallidus]